MRGFQNPILRADRPVGEHGGVMLCVRSGIPYLPITLTADLEVVAARLSLSNSHITVCSLYIPPDCDNNSLCTKLDALILELPGPFIVSADANAHHFA